MSSDHNDTTSLEELKENINSFYLINMSTLVFLMQCGFAFLEAGCVRSKNAINIIMKNMMDCLVAAIAYWAVGYAISLGSGDNPWTGTSGFFSIGIEHKKSYAEWFFDYTFASTCATIVSGSIAERTHIMAYLVYSIAVVGWVYPFVAHWAWKTKIGWLATNGYHDFAGSGVVHILGGSIALVACYLVGPRMGRWDKHGRPPTMPGHSVPLQSLGGFILLLGFLAFNGASEKHITEKHDAEVMDRAVINTLLGGSSGGLVALLITYCTDNRLWSFQAMLNGALAGMVSMGAGSDVYEPWSAVVVGCLAGPVFLGISTLMKKALLDDPLDAVAVHFGGGWLGVVCVYIFSQPVEHKGEKGILWRLTEGDAWKDLGMNVAGATVITLWGFFWAWVIFGLLNKFHSLRVSVAAERKGIDLVAHGELAYPKDAWLEDQYAHGDNRSSLPPFMMHQM